MQGLTVRTTTAGIPVIRLHYEADEKRRTPEWLAEASRGYPGGTSSPRWKKEQEIDYGATGGTLLFPRWDDWQRSIVLPSYDSSFCKIYGSYDHGWNNPACYLVHAVDNDGCITTIWEFYADHVPISDICKIILGQNTKLHDGRFFLGNPYAKREVLRIADPEMWRENVPMLDGPNKSSEYLFQQNGVTLIEGERGGDLTVAEWLHGHLWMDLQNPRYRIVQSCKKLIWEIGKQRHKEYSAQVAQNYNNQESLVDKDNHAWDSLKMFLKRFPPPAKPKVIEDTRNTIKFWKKQLQRQMAGQPLQTYHARYNR